MKIDNEEVILFIDADGDGDYEYKAKLDRPFIKFSFWDKVKMFFNNLFS